jgi:putative ABC transport system substrate-binding protein
MMVAHDLFLMYRRVAELAAVHRLPVLYPIIPIVRAGGLVALAPDLPVVYQSAANIVAHLLAGARAQDTPVEQPTRYVLGINLPAARALGLEVPQSLRLRAGVVVE